MTDQWTSDEDLRQTQELTSPHRAFSTEQLVMIEKIKKQTEDDLMENEDGYTKEELERAVALEDLANDNYYDR